MDYAYFGTPQPPYQHFVGLPPTSFANTPANPAAASSSDSLDVALFPPTYDASVNANAFAFGGLPTTHHGSPDTAIAHTPMPVGSLDSGLGGDLDDSRASRTRSSSEEKESLTPAQSRRKAQNRAAQRAFRERKERHVRDLESKLSALESTTHSLQSDNERLKLALQRARTENELLRATASLSPTSSRPVSVGQPSPAGQLAMDDEAKDKDDDYHVQALSFGAVVNQGQHTGQHTGLRRRTLTREVPASQAWDLMQAHPLVQQGLVDIADVCERLRRLSKCGGQGPVYEESSIRQAIEQSRRNGGDELI